MKCTTEEYNKEVKHAVFNFEVSFIFLFVWLIMLWAAALNINTINVLCGIIILIVNQPIHNGKGEILKANFLVIVAPVKFLFVF